MTRFIENAYEVPEDSVTKWGYEIKILNVKTMKQKVSKGKSNLASYPEIEKHIVENRDKLIRDILALK